MKDLKYLVSYAVPIVAIIGLYVRGFGAYYTPIFAFVLVPILEIILAKNEDNLSEPEILSKTKNKFFNLLLYLNIPLVFGILGWFFWSSTWSNYTTSELIGFIFSLGVVLGSNGINVSHELGHRTSSFERTLGKLLLIPSLYMHFYIEHNFGHHQNAATDEDPASAAFKQTVYSFWFTSIFRQYFGAWTIQLQLLKRGKHSFFSVKNDMLWFSIIQLLYVGGLFFLFGIEATKIGVMVAFTAILMLETINYIEHYGLRRMKTKSGRYERVAEVHSWNSNHILGRIMLYELTRHSDHHYKSHKKYQLLDCHETSPQLPYGYPTSMVLSLVPPLWFSIMNKRIPDYMKPGSETSTI